MVLKGVLRDVHVFAFIYHKCSPELSLWVNGKSWRGGGKRRKKAPQIKKIIKRGGNEELSDTDSFLGGIPLFLIVGRVSSDGVNIT